MFEKIYSKSWSPNPSIIKNIGKTVIQLDNFGNIISTYNSISAAAEAISNTPGGGSARSKISKCCNNTNLKYKGFYWKFK